MRKISAILTAFALLACSPQGAPGMFVTDTRTDSVVTCAGSTTCDRWIWSSGDGICDEVWTAAGTACDDGDACTSGDVCDGMGSCSGTPVVCPAGNACASYSCVSGGCTPSYAPPGTACNDGLACTFSDVCNGSGVCGGAPVACPAPTACVSYSCDGSSACAPSYAAAGVGCDPGNDCMASGACDGAGRCVGTPKPKYAHCGAANGCDKCDGAGHCNAIPAVPSNIWCGYVHMYQGPDNCSGPLQTSRAEVGIAEGTSAAGIPKCLANDAVDQRVPAPVVEIRGWARGSDTPYDPNAPVHGTEEEFHLEVILDVGWDSSTTPAGVIPINSIESILEYVAPQNIIEFGGRGLNPDIFGGEGMAHVHVEALGWGPSRAGGADYRSRRPPGWTYVYGKSDPTDEIYWPFPIQDYRFSNTSYRDATNDYVSLIGTLWDDGDHSHGSLLCLAQAGLPNAWTEMHSPDVIKVMKAPATFHTVVAYSLCGWSTDGVVNSGILTLADRLALTHPTLSSRIVGIRSVSASSFTPPAAPTATWTADGAATFGWKVPIPGTLPGNRYYGTVYYDVTWQSDCPITCPGACSPPIYDGCGGVVDCGACAAPMTCGGGGVPNVCGCTPTSVCGSRCGFFPDGCGGEYSCDCAAGKVCDPDTGGCYANIP